jgi:anti-sigma factor RsiW
MMEKNMDTRPGAATRIDEEDLHALVDGRLSATEAAEMRRRLSADPKNQGTAIAWQLQREALRRTFAEPDVEATPAPLLAAAERAQRLRDLSSQWSRWAGMAAAIVLAFGLGWVANDRFGAGIGAPSGSQLAQQFAHQAAVAHVVYQPEVRHPVEVAASQQEHLVQWLSKRLGRPLKVPVLTPQGYELVGGRLLPGDGGARAQFMYQNAAGQRLTLYIGAVKAGGAANTQETSFRFLDDGPVPGFYWVDQGFGYALSAQLPRAALHDLAKAVYAQIG